MAIEVESGYFAPSDLTQRSVLDINLSGDSLLIDTSGNNLLLSSVDNQDAGNRAHILHSQIWNIPAAVTATSTATGYYADALENSLTYEKWKPDTLPATATFTHPVGSNASACCIAGHTLGTDNATVTVETYLGGAWIERGAFAPDDDSPIMILFPEVRTTNARVTITGAVAPEIAVLRWGVPLTMERNIYGGHAPASLSRQTELRANLSETGQFLGRTKQRQSRPVQFSWQHLTADFVHSNWPALQKGVEEEPFFIAWRPEDYDDVVFGQVDQVPVPSNMGISDLMQVAIDVRGLGYD